MALFSSIFYVCFVLFCFVCFPVFGEVKMTFLMHRVDLDRCLHVVLFSNWWKRLKFSETSDPYLHPWKVIPWVSPTVKLLTLNFMESGWCFQNIDSRVTISILTQWAYAWDLFTWVVEIFTWFRNFVTIRDIWIPLEKGKYSVYYSICKVSCH